MYLAIFFAVLAIFIFILFKSYEDQSVISEKFVELRKTYEELLNQKMENNSKEFSNIKHHSQIIYSTLNPISRTIDNLRDKMENIERQRLSRDANLSNFVSNLVNSQKEMSLLTHSLTNETKKMVNLFKKPNIRGKWGEVQLQRLVEITGMLKYCEFNTQYNTMDKKSRPDMIIHLPNKGCIFVDAKAPIDAYLTLIDNEDNDKFVTDNLKAVKNHIYSLAQKEYWNSEYKSPNFVIMYIPVESLWLHAIDADPEILEYAALKNVVVATPMTLISLLKTVHYGWSQLLISNQGVEFNNTIVTIKKILKSMTNDINNTLKNYYSSIKSLQNCTENLQFIQEELYKLQPLNGVSAFEENNEITQNNSNTDDVQLNQQQLIDQDNNESDE